MFALVERGGITETSSLGTQKPILSFVRSIRIEANYRPTIAFPSTFTYFFLK